MVVIGICTFHIHCTYVCKKVTLLIRRSPGGQASTSSRRATSCPKSQPSWFCKIFPYFLNFIKNVNSSAPKFDLRYPVAYLSAFARSFSNKLSCMYIELKSVKFVRFKCTRMYQNSQYFLKFVLDCFIIF